MAIVAALLQGGLALAVFPVDRQLYKYPLAAQQLLAGTLPAERVLDFSPLYLYLHAGATLLARLFGAEGLAAPIFAVQALQILAISGSAVLLFMLLTLLFPLGLAAWGTAALLLNRSVTLYASVLEPEAFLLVCLLAFLYFVLGTTGRDRTLAGCALALALALRPSAFPLVAIVPLYFRWNEGHWRLRSNALVLAPVLAVTFLLALRNGAAAGAFSPFGMNPGFVFFEGNNPLSSGRSAVYPPLVADAKYEIGDAPDSPHVAYRLIAEGSVGRELTNAEANHFWRDRALAFAADHPGRFLSTLAQKAYSTLHEYRRHDLVAAERFDQRLRDLGVPAIPLALVSALALLGALVSRRDWRKLAFVYALLVSQLALMVVFYSSDRQRLPAVPALIVLACAAVAWLIGAKRSRRALAAVSCGALAVAFTVTGRLAREDRHVWAAYAAHDPLWVRAFQLRDEGRLAEGARAAASAHATAPWLLDYARPAGLPFATAGFTEQALSMLPPEEQDPSRRFDRAQLLIQAGRAGEAEAILEDLIARGERFDRGFLHSSEPLYHLGRVVALRGDRARGVHLLSEAADLAPGDPFVLAQLGALTGDAGHSREIARYFSEIDALFLVGVAQMEHGTQDGGVAKLSEVVRRVPELWRARIYLSAALGARGDVTGAVNQYREALALRSDPAMLEERIVPVFRAAADRASADPRAQRDYALVLEQFGRFEEALIALRSWRSAGGGAEAERALERVGGLLNR